MLDKLNDQEKRILKKYCIGTFLEAFEENNIVKIGDNYVPDNVEIGFLKTGVELRIKNHFTDLRSLLLNTKNIRQVFAFGHRVSKNSKELNMLKERYSPLFDIFEININYKNDLDNKDKFIVWIGKDQFENNQSEKDPHNIELINKINKYSTKVMNISIHYRFKKTGQEPNRDIGPKECPIELKNGEVCTEFLKGGEYGVKNDIWNKDGLIYRSQINDFNQNGGQFYVKGVIYEGQDLDNMKKEELERILNAYYRLDRELSNSIVKFSK